jgi:serine protease AprX
MFISPDHKLRSHVDVASKTINAPLLWSSGYTGTGIGVAVIDSGIDSTLQDLGNATGQTDPAHSRVVFKENFLVPATNPDGHVNPARYQTSDGYGHGTHVAGTIAGNGFLSSGANYTTTYQGMAPGAQLIDFQVLDANGEGSDSAVIAAIEEAINLKSTYNIRVINLSLGRPVYESFALDPLCQAVEAAWKAGIVVVVAAGNDGRDNSFGENGYGTITAPGNDPYVLTVGAMNAKLTPFRGDDVITTYTSKGPTPVDHIVKPDIVAPGNHISSLLAQHGYLPTTYPSDVVNALVYQKNNGPSNYLILNGTSMATGVVSGAVADLLSAHPSLTPDQVKAVLMLSASKTFRTYTDAYYNLAQEAYGTAAQLQQANQSLAQAQAALKQATGQLQPAQNQATQTAQQAQTALTNYNNAASALSTAQANLSTAQSAYNAAVAAQQSGPTTGATANTLKQNVNNAQNAMNQAQNSVKNAQNQVQNLLTQLNTANANAQTAAQALTTVQQAISADTQQVQTLQSQVAALQIPNASMQSQLQQMQSDPSQYTATQYDVFTIGAGYLDLAAAMQNVSAAPAGVLALSPVAYLDPSTSQVMVSGNYAGLCGSTALSQTAAAPLAGMDLCTGSAATSVAMWSFDTTTVSGSQSVWGARSVWGASQFVADTRSVWGAQSVWGARSVWGATATSAYQSIWSNRSVWGADSTAGESAESIITGGDPD